jgi:hypothetical protein
VGIDLLIENNANLTSIEALSALTQTRYSLQISGNGSLTSLTGLSSLTSVGSNLRIENNANLTNIQALSALTRTGNNLQISGNGSLRGLTGLSSLASVGGDLRIENNASLTNIQALSALTRIGASLYIQNNLALSACAIPPICQYLTSPNGFIGITNNAPGCQSQQDVQADCTPLDITVQPPGSVCAGATVSTTGNARAYQWYRNGQVISGQTRATLTLTNVQTSDSGSYSVVVSNSVSSLTSTAFNLAVNPNPTVSINTSTTTICQGQSSTFTAQGASTYQWQGPNGFSSSANSVTVTTSGTYSVTGTTNAGCLASATATLTVNPLPTLSISPSMTAICSGQSATFTAQGASTYQWRGPSGFASSANSVTLTAPGTYSVTGTNAQGCSASATATLTVNPLPSTPTLKTPTNQPGQLYPEGKNNITLPQYAGNVTFIGGACPGGTIRWSGPNNTSGSGNITLSTNQTGTFIYQAVCQVGQCTSAPTSATLTVVKDKLRVVPPLFDCATNKLTLRTTGGNGKPVEYHIASITNGWSSANPVAVSSKDFRRDFDIDARQKESDNTGYDKAQELDDYELPRCGGARLATMEEIVEVPLSVKVLGNPVQGGELSVEIRGAGGQPLQLTLTDSQGRTVVEQQLPRAEVMEHRRLGVGSQPAGIYLLQVSTPSQRQSVKVLKVD